MFSFENIDTIVKRAFDGEIVEVVNHQLNSHSKEKVGFLGDHQDLEITVKRKKSDKSETHRFFVKAVPEDSEQQSKFIRESGVFNQEAVYFNTMLPLLKESYIGEDWCPKCMLASDKFIVLEDMRNKGFAMRTNKTFDSDHLKSAFRTQARLHAASLLAEDRLGKSPKEVCPDACVEQIYSERMLQLRRIDMYADLAQQVAKKLGLNPHRISAGFYRGFMRLYRPEGNAKLTPVVSHGDSWPNNYLFDSSQPPKCILVDFQLVRYAPRMYDVAQLTYLSTTPEMRRKELRQAIEAYHAELCETLRRNNPTLEVPSLEDILEEYEDVKITALMAAFLYYPIIFMSKKELDRYKDDPDKIYKKVVLRETNDYVMELYNKDNEYAKKLNELVLEVVECCEKNGFPSDEENGILTS